MHTLCKDQLQVQVGVGCKYTCVVGAKASSKGWSQLWVHSQLQGPCLAAETTGTAGSCERMTVEAGDGHKSSSVQVHSWKG